MKFKVGDRVVSYCTKQVYKGTVVGYYSTEILEVKDDDDNVNYFRHEKQCRKLVKKKRKEFWIIIRKENTGVCFNAYSVKQSYLHPDCIQIHVREVKE